MDWKLELVTVPVSDVDGLTCSSPNPDGNQWAVQQLAPRE